MPFVNLLQSLVDLRLDLEVALLLSAIASLDDKVGCRREDPLSCEAALRHGDSLEHPSDVLPAGIVASADVKTVCIQGAPADPDRADFEALLFILCQRLPAQGCVSKSCRCNYHISSVILPLPQLSLSCTASFILKKAGGFRLPPSAAQVQVPVPYNSVIPLSHQALRYFFELTRNRPRQNAAKMMPTG